MGAVKHKTYRNIWKYLKYVFNKIHKVTWYIVDYWRSLWYEYDINVQNLWRKHTD